MRDQEFPDAVRIPDSCKSGDNALSRLNSLLGHVEKLLGGNPDKKVTLRPGQHGCWYGLKSPADTLLFPITHPLEGKSRYDWHDQEDGVRFGYLVPEAKEPTVA